MTVLLIDGCEDKSSWRSLQYDGVTVVAARNGNGFRVSNVNNQLQFTCPAGLESDTWTFGVAMRWPSVIGSSPCFTFASDGGGTEQTMIGLVGTGITVWRAPNTVIATYGFTTVANTWYYVEATCRLHDTTGLVEVRLNGVLVLTFNGDTKQGGSATLDSLIINGQGAQLQLDDFYITNDAARLGDIVVETLYPNGNGAVNQWVGSDGDSTNNYSLVDEVIPDPADYVISGTLGEQDLYTMTDLVTTIGSVRGICHAAYCLKTDSGPRKLKLLTRGSTINASPALDMSTAGLNIHYVLTTNPESGAAFTRAQVNALQSGVEVA